MKLSPAAQGQVIVWVGFILGFFACYVADRWPVKQPPAPAPVVQRDTQGPARVKWVNDCMNAGVHATPPKNTVDAMLRDDASLVKECTDAAMRLMPREK